MLKDMISFLCIVLICGCAGLPSTERGMIDNYTYCSTFDPSILIKVDNKFTYKPDLNKEKKILSFRAHGKGFYIQLIENKMKFRETKVLYYHPVETIWHFENTINTDDIILGGKKWHYWDYIKKDKCRIIRQIAMRNQSRDTIVLQYVKGMKNKLCDGWENSKVLTSSQREIYNDFVSDFENDIVVSRYDSKGIYTLP